MTSVAAKMRIVPTSLRKANDFVARHHRHNGRTSRNGGKFALAVAVDEVIVGVAIVGNPLSATLMDGVTAEVLRTCVADEAPPNCNSFLYGACWRVWRNMGGLRLITYTLQTESGASLKAAGFCIVGTTRPVADGWRKKDRLDRAWQPVMGLTKYRWERNAHRQEVLAL